MNDIGTLVEAGNRTAACMANIVSKVGGAKLGQCSNTEGERFCEPTPDPPGGTAHGAARNPGATRTYTCDDGLAMSGKAHSFCTAALVWVPAAPTCLQMVTCNIFMDKDLHAVYADEKEVSTRRHPTLEGFHVAKFPSTARTLGVYGSDRGANGEHLTWQCGAHRNTHTYDNTPQ